MMMESAACSVSVAVVPAVFVIAVLTVMSPSEPPELPVVMVTLLPPVSAVEIVDARIVESLEPGEKFGGVYASPLVVLPMMTLYGSSNHSPGRPAGADASATIPDTSNQWPEVSMCPPLPPLAPPWASSVPYTRVAEFGSFTSERTVISPPLPRPVALASRVAVFDT